MSCEWVVVRRRVTCWASLDPKVLKGLALCPEYSRHLGTWASYGDLGNLLGLTRGYVTAWRAPSGTPVAAVHAQCMQSQSRGHVWFRCCPTMLLASSRAPINVIVFIAKLKSAFQTGNWTLQVECEQSDSHGGWRGGAITWPTQGAHGRIRLQLNWPRLYAWVPCWVVPLSYHELHARVCELPYDHDIRDCVECVRRVSSTNPTAQLLMLVGSLIVG